MLTVFGSSFLGLFLYVTYEATLILSPIYYVCGFIIT